MKTRSSAHNNYNIPPFLLRKLEDMHLNESRYTYTASNAFKTLPDNPEDALYQLKSYVKNHNKKPIQNFNEFLTYRIEFEPLARKLLDWERISDDRCKKLFWDGLDKATRRGIQKDLGIGRGRIPSVRKACEVAGRVLEKGEYVDVDLEAGVLELDAQLIRVGHLVEAVHQLDNDDVLYAVAFAQLMILAPNVAEMIPMPAGWSKTKRGADLTEENEGNCGRCGREISRSRSSLDLQRSDSNLNAARGATMKRVTCEASVLYSMKQVQEVRNYRA